MDSISLLMIIPSTILFLLAFLTFRRTGTQKVSKTRPPGNMGVPFIGETFAFLKPQSLTEMGEFMDQHMSRFGKIFSSHLFGNQSVVSADPEFNRFVLRNEVKSFGHGLPPAFEKVIGPNSISLMVGDAHKHMRSTVLDFLSAERLRTVFLQDAHHHASQLIGSWKEGLVISAKDEATKFSLFIMVKKILSMNLGDPEIERLPKEYDSFVRAFLAFPVYIPGTGYWKAFQSRKYIINIFKQEMKARIGGKGGRNVGKDEDDFLGWLTKNTNYLPEKICDLLLGVLFAGHDTNSRAISLLIYFLESCPKAVQQLREEHLQVIRSKQQGGESKLTWDDFKRMEFTKCVINETLRLGNIARFTIRKATADVEFSGYVIPQGSSVLLHFAAVHLDPSRFEDPENFNPWRWLSSSGIKVPDSFMPFGRGARICPGAELARLEMAVFLHHLILKWDWKLAEPDHPVITPIIEFPKGLPIKVRALSTDSLGSQLSRTYVNE